MATLRSDGGLKTGGGFAPTAGGFGGRRWAGPELAPEEGVVVATSVVVSPSAETVNFNEWSQLSAILHFSDASTQDVTATATWETSNAGVATVNSAGLVTPVTEGTATITATSGAFADTCAITIVIALSSINVIPNTPTIEVPDTLQMTAVGTLGDLSTVDLTATAVWDSSNDAIATVSVAGLVTAVGAGTANITATQSSVVGSETVTIEVPVTVPTDGPSVVYVPNTAGHFTDLGIAVPTSLYLAQEASGDLLDSITTNHMTANAAPGGSGAVPAWTRLSRTFTDATALQRFAYGLGGPFNPATNSIAYLWYWRMPSTPAATRQISLLGGNFVVSYLTTNKIRLSTTVNVDTVNNYNDGLVHPILVVHNRTASTLHLYTDLETVVGTYNGGTTDNAAKGVGAGSTTAPTANLLWAAAWSGAGALTLNAATLTALGW